MKMFQAYGDKWSIVFLDNDDCKGKGINSYYCPIFAYRNLVFNFAASVTFSAMHWLQSLDVSLFRFINQTLSNSIFDVVMPFLSGNTFFFPIVFLVVGWLIWKDRPRGAQRRFVFFHRTNNHVSNGA
jgi:hypothetical protein